MKIAEILAEADQAAPAILPQVAQDYEKGANAVKRILDPKQWFGGKSSSDEKKFASAVEIKDSLNKAAQGKSIYMSDVQILKQVLRSVQDGTYNVANPGFTDKSIKTAILGKPLSKEQSADLQVLAKTF